MAGRRAYDAVDYPAAARILPIGLSQTPSSDTSWTVGAHMLLDALLDQQDSAGALAWAHWILRTAPALRIDSTAFPPRVSRVLKQARASITAPPDSLFATTLERSPDSTPGRGVLRLARANGISFVVVEGIGTMLPGESRTMPAGIVTLHVTYDRGGTAAAEREILPRMTTVITPRLLPAGAIAHAAPAATPAPPAVRGSRLAAGRLSTCAVVSSGGVQCWGDNSGGQLGGGFADTITRGPVAVAMSDSVPAVAAGALHACALTAAGKAWCWGAGPSGELGNGLIGTTMRPVAVAGTQLFVQLAAGGNHACGLTGTGDILCWGSNRDGQLGNRTNTNATAPTPIAMPSGVTFTGITAGTAHTCALAANGSTWCWGANGGGQLGTGTTTAATAPVVVQSGVPFKAIAAGGAFTCGLTATGAAWCWGANASGQLGTGSADADQLRPVQVTGGLVFDSIEAGESHACGLTHDGAAYCWGAGRSGQLGNGQLADSPRPVLVVGGDVIQSLSLGMGHSCARAADGVTRCWGSNAQGALGSLGGRASAVPVAVIVRPAPRPASSGPAMTSVRERFADNDWTANPAWTMDSAAGLTASVVAGAVDVTRRGGRGAVSAGGLTLPVRIPVTITTQVQFDVMVGPDSARRGCGLNCASWPAVVRLRVRNTDLSESEVWYAYGPAGGASRTLGSVVIVAKGDAPAGEWLRGQTFTVRDALPRADTILQVSIGGIGSDFSGRFDNLLVPVTVLDHFTIRPDSVTLTRTANRRPLTADARDAAGAAITGIAVTWSSSDSSVARVDSAGVVTGLKRGRAIVRATAGTLSDSVIVKVSSVPAPPRRATRSPR